MRFEEACVELGLSPMRERRLVPEFPTQERESPLPHAEGGFGPGARGGGGEGGAGVMRRG